MPPDIKNDIGALRTEMSKEDSALRKVADNLDAIRFLELNGEAVFGAVEALEDSLTIIQKLAPSPQSFGAIGDGVTDDTASLKLWLADIAGKAGRLPAGIYKFTETLTVPSGTLILGDGCGRWGKNNRGAKNKDMDGSILLACGEFTKTESIFGSTDMRTSGGVITNPSSINAYDTEYSLTDFYNEDANTNTGAAATPKLFSAAIKFAEGGRSSIRDVRIMLSFNGDPSLTGFQNDFTFDDGYTGFENGLGSSSCDMGIFAENHHDGVLDGVLIVGYWRMAGMFQYAGFPNKDVYPTDTAEIQAKKIAIHTERWHFRDCWFQGQVGYMHRASDCYHPTGRGSDWLEIEWADNHPFDLDLTGGVFRAGDNDSRVMFFTGTQYVAAAGGEPAKLRLTGMTPDPTTVSTLDPTDPSSKIYPMLSTRGVAGTSFEDCVFIGMEHASAERATEIPGSPTRPAACVELSGHTARRFIFERCRWNGCDDTVAHIHECGPVWFGTMTHIENKDTPTGLEPGFRVIASPLEENNDRVANPAGFTEEVRLLDIQTISFSDWRPYIADSTATKIDRFRGAGDTGLFNPNKAWLRPVVQTGERNGGASLWALPDQKAGIGIQEDRSLRIYFDEEDESIGLRFKDNDAIINGILINNNGDGVTTIGTGLEIQDGTVATPGLSFASDSDTGIYKGTFGISFAVGGQGMVDIQNNGLFVKAGNFNVETGYGLRFSNDNVMVKRTATGLEASHFGRIVMLIDSDDNHEDKTFEVRKDTSDTSVDPGVLLFSVNETGVTETAERFKVGGKEGIDRVEGNKTFRGGLLTSAGVLPVYVSGTTELESGADNAGFFDRTDEDIYEGGDVTGQSLAAGGNADISDVGLTTIAIDPGNALMLNGVGVTGPDPRNVDTFTGFQDLKERADTETVSSGLAKTYLDRCQAEFGSKPKLVVSVAATGGEVLSDLVRGSLAYTERLRNIKACFDQAAALGKRYVHKWTVIIHGEADGGHRLTPSLYRKRLEHSCRCFAEDVRLITGQTENIHTFVTQTAANREDEHFLNPSAEAQVSFAERELPFIHFAGPIYQYAVNASTVEDDGVLDSVHPASQSMRYIGEEKGHYVFETVKGVGGNPMFPGEIYFSGAYEITIEVPKAFPVQTDLVVDTSGTYVNTTGIAASAGFNVRDVGGSSLTVTGVSITQDDWYAKIILTLSGTPTGHSFELFYANERDGDKHMNQTGARGLIRDSSTRVASQNNYPLYSWFPSFRRRVTTLRGYAGDNGWSGSFINGDGDTVTVVSGIITAVTT